jgi:hypothetical protein
MQLALRSRQATIITQGLLSGGRNWAHTYNNISSSPYRKPSFAIGRESRQTYGVSGCQSLIRGVQTGVLSKGKGPYGVTRRFTKSSLDSGDGRKTTRYEKQTEPREQGSHERNGSEEIEEEDEGTERLGRETRSRDSFGNSAEKGTILRLKKFSEADIQQQESY